MTIIKHKWQGPLYSGLMILLLWELIALALRRPIVPSPVQVAINITQIFSSSIQTHLLYSLGRISAGIAISIAIGVPLGYLMGYYRKIDKALSSLIYFTYPVPKLALLPVVMLLFGLGEVSKIIMIVMIVVFQIVITARDAVHNIPQATFRSLRALGASRWQKLSEVMIPASLPDILTATRVALGTAISILFFTETFGTEFGMGYFIMDAWMRINYIEMYSGIVVLSLMGFTLFALIDLTENLICGWRQNF